MTSDSATARLIAAAEAAQAEFEALGDIAFVRTRARAEDPCQVYSVLIPVDRIDHLRQRAEDEGITVGVLVRRWVLERLDAVEPAQDGPEERPDVSTTRTSERR